MKTIFKNYNIKRTKKDVSISPYSPYTSLRKTIFLNILLPFEPTLFPKLQVYLADFPYLLYTILPEAINLEDLMRLLVRNGLKIICIFFHNTSFFMEQKQYTVDGKNKHIFEVHLFFLKMNVNKFIHLLKQIKSTSLNKSSSILFQYLKSIEYCYSTNFK